MGGYIFCGTFLTLFLFWMYKLMKAEDEKRMGICLKEDNVLLFIQEDGIELRFKNKNIKKKPVLNIQKSELKIVWKHKQLTQQCNYVLFNKEDGNTPITDDVYHTLFFVPVVPEFSIDREYPIPDKIIVSLTTFYPGGHQAYLTPSSKGTIFEKEDVFKRSDKDIYAFAPKEV